jgi:hypothetical protein
LEGPQTIIAAIKDTPEDMPIDLVIHTPGGLLLAAMQIARAVEAHKAKVTVYVPVYAMSGGTLIALAADEIVLGEFSVLGPIDPQIAGLPAASIIKARDSKPIESVFDLTLVLADVSEKALDQVKRGAIELLTPRMEQAAAACEGYAFSGHHTFSPRRLLRACSQRPSGDRPTKRDDEFSSTNLDCHVTLLWGSSNPR